MLAKKTQEEWGPVSWLRAWQQTENMGSCWQTFLGALGGKSKSKEAWAACWEAQKMEEQFRNCIAAGPGSSTRL